MGGGGRSEERHLSPYYPVWRSGGFSPRQFVKTSGGDVIPSVTQRAVLATRRPTPHLRPRLGNGGLKGVGSGKRR